jgi:Cu2+-exporting ATPase
MSTEMAERQSAQGAGGEGRHREHALEARGDHGDHAAAFRDRFWLTLALTIPVVLFSEHVQM